MRILFFLLIMVVALVPSSAFAGSFEIAPTTIFLTNSEPSVFYITNHGTEPIIAQIESYAWSQTDKDQLDETDALIISPPMIKLMPQQQQTIRMMARPGSASAGERSFRLMVSEIPDPTVPNEAGKIRMLLQFNVPVFVDNGGNAPTPPLNWSAAMNSSGLILTAHNTAKRHTKISSVALENSVGQKVPVDDGKFRYILPGNSWSWTIPQPAVTPGQILHIKAFDEISNTAIDSSVRIQ